MNVFYEYREEKLNISTNGSLAYNAHLHEHIELVYMKSGKAHAFAGGVDCELEAGDFFVVFPNCIHYYDNCQDDKSIVVIVSGVMMPEYREIFSTKMLVNPVVKGVCPEAGQLMEILVKFAEIETRTENCRGILRGLLLAIFGMIFQKMELKAEKSKVHTTIQAILGYCEQNYKNEISVQKVADALHLSPSYVSHSFSDKIHLSFREYINSLRLNEAKNLLEVGNLSMTEIALEAGFGTIRNFNRVFKKKHGMTPSEYRKSIKA